MLWIRVSNFSGSGFQISLDTDPDFDSAPIRIRIPEQKKRKSSKSDLLEENLKIMTKDAQKMKNATFFLIKIIIK